MTGKRGRRGRMWDDRQCAVWCPPRVSRGKTHRPLFLQRIHRATQVIRPLQHQTPGLCFVFWEVTYLLIDVRLEGPPTSCVHDNIQVTGVRRKASSHATCSMTFRWDVSLWGDESCYLTQGLRACPHALFCLRVHQQADFRKWVCPLFYLVKITCHQHMQESTSWIFDWNVLVSRKLPGNQHKTQLEVTVHCIGFIHLKFNHENVSLPIVSISGNLHYSNSKSVHTPVGTSVFHTASWNPRLHSTNHRIYRGPGRVSCIYCIYLSCRKGDMSAFKPSLLLINDAHISLMCIRHLHSPKQLQPRQEAKGCEVTGVVSLHAIMLLTIEAPVNNNI